MAHKTRTTIRLTNSSQTQQAMSGHKCFSMPPLGPVVSRARRAPTNNGHVPHRRDDTRHFCRDFSPGLFARKLQYNVSFMRPGPNRHISGAIAPGTEKQAPTVLSAQLNCPVRESIRAGPIAAPRCIYCSTLACRRENQISPRGPGPTFRHSAAKKLPVKQSGHFIVLPEMFLFHHAIE